MGVMNENVSVAGIRNVIVGLVYIRGGGMTTQLKVRGCATIHISVLNHGFSSEVFSPKLAVKHVL